MKTLLQEAKKEFDRLNKKHKGYSKPALLKVIEYNKEYRKKYPDKYPYNDDIVEYIAKKENISAEMIDCLKTEVYLSQNHIQKEKEKERDDKMAEQGFIRINVDTAKNIPINTKCILKRGSLLGKYEEKCRIMSNEGEAFFLPGRNRRKGYSTTTLAYGDYPAYYKIIA